MVSIRPSSDPAFPPPSVPASPFIEAVPFREDLPSMYELPSDDPEEPGLPDVYHDLQPQLLSRTLNLSQYTNRQCFTGTDINLYYDADHLQWYKRPDWFLAVGVPLLYAGKDLRLSYVIWKERQVPRIVVEFLSPGTAAEDLGRFVDSTSPSDSGDDIEFSTAPPTAVPAKNKRTRQSTRQRQVGQPPEKLEVYERYLKVPHYIVYSRYTGRLRYFKWIAGTYQEQPLRPRNPLIWLEDLGIGLGIWQGEFEDIEQNWLRWCDADGNWFLTDTETERQAKEQERQAKEQAEAQILQAARNLLATGMPLAQVIEILSLSADQVEVLRQAIAPDTP
ncbi:MAG: Uma2 family endonuclease [Oculatellaceae cyanobacterium Prado106]|jgi:Uma2 family endonuclease|nr:Uma2 family endonuclease [Oculatellaceae cyanobacterium Prado106]